MGTEKAAARIDRLLRKTRSPSKEKLVDAVLRADLDTTDKALRIEMVDLLPEQPLAENPRTDTGHRILLRTEGRDRISYPRSSPIPGPDEHQQVIECRQRLELHPARGLLRSYFFGGHRAIKRFGVETNTIAPGFFPLTLRLSQEARRFESVVVTREGLEPLESPLEEIIKFGWRSLTKLDYNLLASLSALCQRIRSTCVTAPPGNSDGDWMAILPSIVVFWTDRTFPRSLLSAWKNATVALGLSPGIYQDGLHAIDILLQTSADSISLPTFVRALFILKARRMVYWAELSPNESGECFERDTFDCTREVQRDISHSISTLCSRFDRLMNSWEEMSQFARFQLSSEEAERFQPRIGLEDWAWCRGFIAHVLETLGPLFAGQIRLVGGRKVSIFHRGDFASALSGLATIGERFHDPLEADKRELLISAGRLATSLAKSIVNLVWQAHHSDMVGPDHLDQSSVLETIPLASEIVEAPTNLAGMTVAQAVEWSGSILVGSSSRLGVAGLQCEPEDLDEVRDAIRSTLAKLSRLAPDSVSSPCHDRFRVLDDRLKVWLGRR